MGYVFRGKVTRADFPPAFARWNFPPNRVRFLMPGMTHLSRPIPLHPLAPEPLELTGAGPVGIGGALAGGC